MCLCCSAKRCTLAAEREALSSGSARHCRLLPWARAQFNLLRAHVHSQLVQLQYHFTSQNQGSPFSSLSTGERGSHSTCLPASTVGNTVPPCLHPDAGLPSLPSWHCTLGLAMASAPRRLTCQAVAYGEPPHALRCRAPSDGPRVPHAQLEARRAPCLQHAVHWVFVSRHSRHMYAEQRRLPRQVGEMPRTPGSVPRCAGGGRRRA